ncbi:unnamed protein product [Chilo suppressalis]|uniref:Carboxylic ester hydrolase n=1 Tax=Chilo suppressalis TaxID=168631 RepID=A0ABN8AUH8_CHISP|nr:unnamed protein product [Chilo suppressalis]
MARRYTYLNMFLGFLFGIGIANLKVDPLVNTDLGLIRGVRANDGDYSMFMGIPYAQVNASNPFGAAIPQPPFEGLFEADDDSAICPQIEEINYTIMGSLDCLHLNIYVPSIANSQKKLPVLVWIHGGGYRSGSAGRYLFGPKFIVRHDVILITMNYRLGAYGFMSLDTPENPGNEGLKDQLIALKWIKKNVEAFGGDSDKITLFGESAGGRSVDFHLLSPNEKLFDKVIIQSGTTLGPAFYAPHKDAPLILATHLGLVTEDKSEAISFLASIHTDLIVAATYELGLVFRPCLEKPFEEVDAFITENWIEANVPKVRGMPILLGFTDDEKLVEYINQPKSYFENLNNIFYERLHFGFDVDSPDFEGMIESVRRFYISDGTNDENVKYQISNFDSDFTYIHPTSRSISKYLVNGAGNIYQYVFSYNGDRSFGKRDKNFTDSIAGAVHADEIGYLFDARYYDQTPSADDQLVIDRITMLWTNFAKYGNPTPIFSELLPITWTPITKNSLQFYLDINLELSLGVRPFHNRMAFWDLFYLANVKLQRMYPGTEDGNSSFCSLSDDCSFDNVVDLGSLVSKEFSATATETLNVCHINAQSIPCHYTELLNTFTPSSVIHAILISESWLKPCLSSVSVDLPGYTLIRNDRIDYKHHIIMGDFNTDLLKDSFPHEVFDQYLSL